MPSGKKARGRKNRAKKEATRFRTLWEPTNLRDNSNSSVNNNATASSCEHILAAIPQIPQEGPAVSFMNCLAGDGLFDEATRFSCDRSTVELGFEAIMRFPEVVEEESERSLAINLLLRFMRNVFVHDSVTQGEKWFVNRAQNEVAICCAIYTLEICGAYSDMSVMRRRAAKTDCRLGTYSDGFVVGRRTRKTGGRLVYGNRRDVVKFVAKRLPCTCLKKLHCAARKKVGKVGACHCCLKKFPISQLHVCTGCMVAEYCSKECQRAERSSHKPYCHSPEVISDSRYHPADYVVTKT